MSSHYAAVHEPAAGTGRASSALQRASPLIEIQETRSAPRAREKGMGAVERIKEPNSRRPNYQDFRGRLCRLLY